MSFAAVLQQGYGQLDAIEQRIKERQEQSGRLFRFFIKPDEETRIIFLDDNPPIIEEHNLKLNGKWGHFFTCLRVLGQKCPLCESGDRPYTVGFYTIVDRTVYKSKKDGKEYRDQVRVLAAKFNSLRQFKKLSSKYGTLAGLEFEVSRTTDKAPSIGDIYTKEARWDADDLEELLGKPVDEVLPDWEKYLAPKSVEELVKVVGGNVSDFDTEDDLDFE